MRRRRSRSKVARSQSARRWPSRSMQSTATMRRSSRWWRIRPPSASTCRTRCSILEMFKGGSRCRRGRCGRRTPSVAVHRRAGASLVPEPRSEDRPWAVSAASGIDPQSPTSSLRRPLRASHTAPFPTTSWSPHPTSVDPTHAGIGLPPDRGRTTVRRFSKVSPSGSNIRDSSFGDMPWASSPTPSRASSRPRPSP